MKSHTQTMFALLGCASKTRPNRFPRVWMLDHSEERLQERIDRRGFCIRPYRMTIKPVDSTASPALKDNERLMYAMGLGGGRHGHDVFKDGAVLLHNFEEDALAERTPLAHYQVIPVRVSLQPIADLDVARRQARAEWNRMFKS